MSPCILTPLTDLVLSEGTSSLFAHSVHENVSPTYALPKASGRFSAGLRINLSFLLASDGYASEALGEIPSSCEFGSGYCVASDGRESLQLW
jgi:hypothetical protein